MSRILSRKLNIFSVISFFVVLIFCVYFSFIRFSDLAKKNNPTDVYQVQAQITDCDAMPNNWPQVGYDPQHTGYSPQPLGQNINNVAWVHPFQPDKVYPQVQPIIYCNKVFVGTEGANGEKPTLYAFNAQSGVEEWKYEVQGSILSSVAAGKDSQGRYIVYLSSMDGNIYALRVDTTNPNGELVWKSNLPRANRYGFSASPLLAENKLFIGRRDGTFYALDPLNGTVLWTKTTSAPIMQPAVYNNGRVFFSSMDMRVHAVDTANPSTFAWETPQLTGMAFHDYWPMAHKGRVIFSRTNAAGLALLETTGAETPINYAHWPLMHGAMTPVCEIPDSRPEAAPGSMNLVIPAWGEYDIDSNTVLYTYIDGTGETGVNNGDENTNLSCAQNAVVVFHTYEASGGAPYSGIFDLTARTWRSISPGQTKREMWNNTQGGGGNPPSMVDGWVFHVSRHNLIVRNTN
ncbi:hypothetical protein COV24_01505 [candidate division WWE3 bacterium CG10_big_fil_rev_8_21_14_0_10_32_10]|uniref:Pyrrolo-quinoline quinone repeat domain-containing protein n=1 Tax=candidate division WWE3 bacterium CG10_big_fil_rev_8_21_14_0_10_32_10 TaxID=1975090 RepID=A0A2H0RB52_UNCKA|nr:MAG: hypothetical protein COV24_01505 [candidate division WWE3 bacterium CG10_big_fil_rev_8_21_14_0_10_32_10]